MHQSTTAQRTTVTRAGTLAAVLRELAAEIEIDEADGWRFTRINLGRTSFESVGWQYGILIDRERHESRVLAGFAAECPDCHGLGRTAYPEDHDEHLNRWNADAERFECLRCDGVGYLTEAVETSGRDAVDPPYAPIDDLPFR